MKTKSILLSVVIVCFITACNTHPPKEDKCAKGDSCCAKKDSAGCKKDSGCCKNANYSKIIAAKIYIKAGKEAEFTKLFKVMIDSTVKESGNTGYQLFQSPYEKDNFLVFETYKNQAAIDAHFAAGYFKAFGDKVAPIVSKPSEITIYDVAKEVKK
jgi:(4S)-4-hydroxy-5-phosphonooxypentane-2,3-dione isomerase